LNKLPSPTFLLKGIAEAWGRSLDKDLGRGGYAAFRHLEAILRLTQYCEQNRPDYGAMTDEELLDRLVQAEAVGQ